MTATTVSPLRRAPRTARPPAGPDLHVVRETRPRHTAAYMLATIVLIGAAVFGAVSMNALATGEAVTARTLEADVAAAERAYGALVAEVAALEDPGRIREAALDLGLEPAGPARVLAVERTVPADGGAERSLDAGSDADPLKPVLSADR